MKLFDSPFNTDNFPAENLENWQGLIEAELNGKSILSLIKENDHCKIEAAYLGNSEAQSFMEDANSGNDWQIIEYCHRPEEIDFQLKQETHGFFIVTKEIRSFAKLLTAENKCILFDRFIIDESLLKKNRLVLPLIEREELSSIGESAFRDTLKKRMTLLMQFKHLNFYIPAYFLDAYSFEFSEQIIFTSLFCKEISELILSEGYHSDIWERFEVVCAGSPHFLGHIAGLYALKNSVHSIIYFYFSKQIDLRITCINSIKDFSLFDAENNLLRICSQAMASAFASVDRIILSPFDLRNPKESHFATDLSRNIHYLLKHESYLNRVRHPLKGSFVLENMISQLCSYCEASIKESALNHSFSVYTQRLVSAENINSAKERSVNDFHHGKRRILGVNSYANPLEKIDSNPIQESAHFFVASALEQLRIQINAKDINVYYYFLSTDSICRSRFNFVLQFTQSAGIQMKLVGKLEELTEKNVLILIGSDNDYLKLSSEFISQFKSPLIIAGKPSNAPLLKEYGIQEFLHSQSNLYTFNQFLFDLVTERKNE